MVESGGLENRCTLTGTVGSNPTLSATVLFRVLNVRIFLHGFVHAGSLVKDLDFENLLYRSNSARHYHFH